ncbi:MAG: ABC transporter permease [Chloroflexi bacterium]|nr:ABC transporter permease [Chloroflexota bacterium]
MVNRRLDAAIDEPDAGCTLTTYRVRQMKNPWIAFLARRLLSACLVCVGVLFAAFIMVRLIPGDPAVTVAGQGASAERITQVRDDLGLNEPVLQQFADYSGRLLHGDMGTSFQLSQKPVRDLVAERTGNSVQLAVSSLLAVLILSLPFGMLMGGLTVNGRHRTLEVGFTAVSSLVGALPEFLLATFLAFIFAVWLRLLPVAGDAFPQNLILPLLAVILRPVFVLSRLVRVETLNALSTDYIRTARSKQLPSHVIYLRHVLPNVTTAALTIGGLLFSGVIGGAVIVENIFNRPGLGTTLVNAVHANDYPVVQAVVLLLGFTVVAANAMVDIAVAILNPRSLTRGT